MASIVRQIRRGGTSAARMRGALRAITHPVRKVSQASAGEALTRVMGSLPPEVLGENLVQLMSAPLQRALRAAPVASGDPALSRRTARLGANSTDALGSAPLLQPSAAGDSRRGRRTVSGEGSVRERADPAPAGAFARADSRARAASIPASDRAAAERAAMSGAVPSPPTSIRGSDRRESPPTSDGSKVGASPLESAGVLGVKIREYWQLARREQQRTADAARAPMSADRATSRTDPDALAPAAGAERVPALNASAVEERLRGFVAGRLPSELGARREISQVAPPGALAAGGHLNRRSALIGESASPLREPQSNWDLSERMADLLREQALQHGIDLT